MKIPRQKMQVSLSRSYQLSGKKEILKAAIIINVKPNE